MSLRLLFAGVAVLAGLAGTALWLVGRPTAPPTEATAASAEVAPAAIHAVAFRDSDGSKRSLAQFPGQVLVVNFWATWCGPCREEMPAFTRIQGRWAGKGVQFIGLANDDPDKVQRFARDLGINYPLWTGGPEVMELSRRLGNRTGVLPHTVLLDPQGTVLESRIGVYEERALDERLALISAKTR